MTALILAAIMVALPTPTTGTWLDTLHLDGLDRYADRGTVESPSRTTPSAGVLPDATWAARGWATWCAPTPRYCHGWGGNAMVGAMPTFRWGDPQYRVRVCRQGTDRCATVTVVSYCACGDRRGEPTVIDISPAAFRKLAPLSTGVVKVEVRPVDGSGPVPTPPATDVGP